MDKKDKTDLIVALCGYLPYGVYVDVGSSGFSGRLHNIDVLHKFNGTNYVQEMISSVDFFHDGNLLNVENFKPHLRKMSDMTEEELKEFVGFTSVSNHRFFIGDNYYWYNTYEEEDWLNKHFFDYRRLIDRGLAIEVHYKDYFGDNG